MSLPMRLCMLLLSVIAITFGANVTIAGKFAGAIEITIGIAIAISGTIAGAIAGSIANTITQPIQDWSWRCHVGVRGLDRHRSQSADRALKQSYLLQPGEKKKEEKKTARGQ